MPSFECIELIDVTKGVLEVRMNRPNKRNAFNKLHYTEIKRCFRETIPSRTDVRCVVLTGAGPLFSAGIDISDLSLLMGTDYSDDDGNGKRNERQENDPVLNRAFIILREGGVWQSAWKALNDCLVPVIAVIHKACLGAALELVSWCDVRFCTQDCTFSAPEVDLGLAADIGGNQMFPRLAGNDSWVRELMLSGRKFDASEAKEFGLVSRVLPSQDACYSAAVQLATNIAAKSPVAVTGVKKMLNYTRDHSVQDSLDFSLIWNSAMLQTTDATTAGIAFAAKQKAVFPDRPKL